MPPSPIPAFQGACGGAGGPGTTARRTQAGQRPWTVWPGHGVLGVLAVPGGVGPPFRVRWGPLAATRPGLQVLRLGQFGVWDSEGAGVFLGGPTVGQGTGISGLPWAHRTWQQTGPWAALGLPVLGACHSRACFPAGALSAVGSGAEPWGSQGPQWLWEAIFLPDARGRASIVVKPLALVERERRGETRGLEAAPSLHEGSGLQRACLALLPGPAPTSWASWTRFLPSSVFPCFPTGTMGVILPLWSHQGQCLPLPEALPTSPICKGADGPPPGPGLWCLGAGSSFQAGTRWPQGATLPPGAEADNVLPA